MTTLAYADKAIRMTEIAPLTEHDIARATGAEVATVRSWLQRTRAPSGVRADRVVELAAIVEQLAKAMKPESISVWLNKPVPALDNRTPADVLAEGGYERVAALVDELVQATFS